MKKALIIFVRNPVLGKVKTRLAKTAGDERALEIYLQLLHHTHSITKELACGKYVFYDDKISRNDLWEDDIYGKYQQQGDDLGERMLHAFNSLFAKGYNAVAIIGSDCMELTTEIITKSFRALLRHEVVIGPSADGGYYLLGLTKMYSSLFHQMEWSTDSVLHETVNRCKDGGFMYSLLASLHDIDDELSWVQYQASKIPPEIKEA